MEKEGETIRIEKKGERKKDKETMRKEIGLRKKGKVKRKGK
jgi:hypothetical protein